MYVCVYVSMHMLIQIASFVHQNSCLHKRTNMHSTRPKRLHTYIKTHAYVLTLTYMHEQDLVYSHAHAYTTDLKRRDGGTDHATIRHDRERTVQQQPDSSGHASPLFGYCFVHCAQLAADYWWQRAKNLQRIVQHVFRFTVGIIQL